MTHKFKPLLSAKVFVKKPEDTAKNIEILGAHLAREPAQISIKWDGWRMFEHNGRALCRSMDPPKNVYVQKVMAEFFRDLKERTKLVGIDGEAIGGSDRFAGNAMQLSTSAFNTHEKVTDFTFNVFDSYQFADRPFIDRLDLVRNAVEIMKGDWPWLHYTEHREIGDLETLMSYLAYVENELKGEGVMGRSSHGRYKMGRSSMKDGILWALKPYADGECEILSIHEMMHNANEATVNSLGHTKRSGHKENMVPKGTFGYAICKGLSPEWPETFRIGMGPGLTDAFRKYIWEHPEEFVGGTLKYKYQAIGCVDRPRQPKWMGMRAKEDLV